MFTHRKSKSRLALFFIIFNLLLIGMTPALPVQADAQASPLSVSGDFLWAKRMGGVGYFDWGYGIAVDSSGNVYTTGYFEGTVDFDPGVGTYNLTSAGADDIFISKIDSSGSFVWAKRMGGVSNDYGYGIAVDSSGNVYTTGYFGNTADFDPGVGIFNLTSAGETDIFVSKLDSSGSFVWAKRMGGVSIDFGYGIAVDSTRNVYTIGNFKNTVDFDPDVGTYNLTSAGAHDIFISKIDSSGSFVWAKRMGGAGYDYGKGISVDSSGNIYTTGSFENTADFDPGVGIFNLTSAGETDIYISKLDSSGSFVWAKRTGGTGIEASFEVAVDSSDNVYATGYFEGTVDFDPGVGTVNLTSAGGADIFISKLGNNGNFVWAKRMGGVADDHSYSITVDSSGNVYTTGLFQYIADFDPGVGTSNLTSAGSYDIFVSKLNSGGIFLWAKGMGGTGFEGGMHITIDLIGNVYTTGHFTDTADFDPGAGTYNLTSAGGDDIFISKLVNTIYITGTTGVAGATLNYTDSMAKTITADGSGNYSITVPAGWSGTVTPYKTGYTFTPVNRIYNNVQSDQTTQNYTATVCVGCADVNILIGGTPMGQYTLPAQDSTRQSFTGTNNGPVQIASTNAVSIIGAERVIYNVNGVNTSFSEMMGLPNSQLSTTYWLPWYNNVDLDTQLRFGNVSGSTATVHVFIGGVEMTGSPFSLLTGGSTRISFAGVNNGPVKVLSDVNIVAAERVIYKVNGTNTSFSEMMALPDSQLSTTYWLPWYNNVDLDTQLRFGNVSGSTATVHVFIGGAEMTGSPFTLLTGQSTRISFAGVNNGPVKVLSDVNIVAAERVIYKVNGTNTSFSEMMALPDSLLNTTYWLPWYNNVDLDTQLRFGNVSGSTATVHVFIGGAEMTGSPFTLLTGQSTRVSFAGVNNGPVKVISDVNIVAAERVIYNVNGVNTSFSEMMGLPNSLLNTTYWLPWYNNVDLNTQFRFGMP